MLVLVDNYDSFTYNLYQILGELGAEVTVLRNDSVTVAEVESMRPERIVISPGPCTPGEAGISTDVIRFFGDRIPVLGVCLGHQCIGAAYGAQIHGAGEIVHGKLSRVSHDGKGVFRGLPDPLDAVRYHSLVIDADTVPSELLVTAWTESGIIMGVRHKTHKVEGIQFHPESILTPDGKQLLQNFLDIPG